MRTIDDFAHINCDILADEYELILSSKTVPRHLETCIVYHANSVPNLHL